MIKAIHASHGRAEKSIAAHSDVDKINMGLLDVRSQLGNPREMARANATFERLHGARPET